MAQSLEETVQAHCCLADKYDHVVVHICSLPSFAEFLQPEKAASLWSAARSGPVVIVNAHMSCCDALILHPHTLQFSHVLLPRLEALVAQKMQIQLAGCTQRVSIFVATLWL